MIRPTRSSQVLAKTSRPRSETETRKDLVVSHHLTDGQMVKVLVQVDRFLPAFLVDLLFEIAVAIEQTDRDKIQIKIARRFAMIAGKNSKPAGVIRD